MVTRSLLQHQVLTISRRSTESLSKADNNSVDHHQGTKSRDKLCHNELIGFFYKWTKAEKTSILQILGVLCIHCDSSILETVKHQSQKWWPEHSNEKHHIEITCTWQHINQKNKLKQWKAWTGLCHRSPVFSRLLLGKQEREAWFKYYKNWCLWKKLTTLQPSPWGSHEARDHKSDCWKTLLVQNQLAVACQKWA